MSYLNLLGGPDKACGCMVGDRDTVDGVTILGHLPECHEFHAPRRYTWTAGGETRTGTLAEMVADRDAWAPGLFTGEGRNVPVRAGDGERFLRARPLEAFGQAPGSGWRAMVDDERVDVAPAERETAR